MSMCAKWLRRARPLLGTLVEIGVPDDALSPDEALRDAFAAVAAVQRCMSRFDSDSDVARFNALAPGADLGIDTWTAEVLDCAERLREATDGLFDVSLGAAPHGWRRDGRRLRKLHARAWLDLDGIAKGYAVDRAVSALVSRGCRSGWVNAGGDLRAFGAARLALMLRDERSGGVCAFGTLHAAAFATSHYDAGSRSSLHAGRPVAAHVSVRAPHCMMADALTKVVAISGDPTHPALADHGATAWCH